MTRTYKKYDIYLDEEDRRKLREFTSKGNNPAMIVRRANVILAVDKNGENPLPCKETAKLFGIDPTSVTNIKSDFLSCGDVESFLSRKVRETPPREIKITGEVEAHILALCCQDPPEGYSRWTLKLLAEKSVELGFIDSIGPTSVWTVLKKANISLT